MFAKLYGPDDHQVLVKLDEGDEGPEVRFYFKPAGLGICSSALIFKDDTDDAWEKAEAAFASIDEQKAMAVVGEIKESLAKHFSDGQST
ncbi:hypothetical protein [Methylomonas sp. 11b]|uniref:hypothetical protein n=1 Tax=Methylomonas sp. 11b TaxID=1168169 RepID=UPI00047ABC16|nr:hypothetical protein [Methylomonas sp. 11b]